jgi:sulfite reductase alpha subunit-like flavoprotein
VEPWKAGLWDAVACAVSGNVQHTTTAPTADSTSPSTSAPELSEQLPIKVATGSDLPQYKPSTISVEFKEGNAIETSATDLAQTSSFDGKSQFLANLVGGRWLTAPDALKKVLYLSIDISGSGFKYLPGDR